MTDSNPQHEPTMEEILASIRKIISEDEPEQPAAVAAEPEPPEPEPEPAPAPKAAPAPAPDEPPAAEPDVLELTDEVQDGELPAEPEPEPEPEPETEPEPEPEVQAAPALEDDVVFEAVEETPEEDDLISDSTRDAVGRALGRLDEKAPPSSGGDVESVFVRAVQEAFRPMLHEWVDSHKSDVMEQMKPLIRAWMDENLPPLIESTVQKEISRTRRR